MATTFGKDVLDLLTPPSPSLLSLLPPPMLPLMTPLGALLPAGHLPGTKTASEAGRIGPRYHIPSSSTRIGSREKGELFPGASSTSEADTATPIQVLAPPPRNIKQKFRGKVRG